MGRSAAFEEFYDGGIEYDDDMDTGPIGPTGEPEEGPPDAEDDE